MRGLHTLYIARHPNAGCEAVHEGALYSLFIARHSTAASAASGTCGIIEAYTGVQYFVCRRCIWSLHIARVRINRVIRLPMLVVN